MPLTLKLKGVQPTGSGRENEREKTAGTEATLFEEPTNGKDSIRAIYTQIEGVTVWKH